MAKIKFNKFIAFSMNIIAVIAFCSKILNKLFHSGFIIFFNENFKRKNDFYA